VTPISLHATREGGARPTTRTTGRGANPRKPRATPQPRTPCAARPDDNAELDAYIKQVVDSLPPLTDEQRDVLALIFRGAARE